MDDNLKKLHERFASPARVSDPAPTDAADTTFSSPADGSASAGPVADLPLLDPAGLDQLERDLRNEPTATLERVRHVFDSDLTAAELADLIAQIRASMGDADAALTYLDLSIQAGLGNTKLPASFSFQGMNKDLIPIDPENTRFETKRDALGWAYNTGYYWLRSKVHQPKATFRWAEDHASLFIYPMAKEAEKTRVGLFSDFGTGIYHSRYIGKHLAEWDPAPHHIFHLGDVYYAGKQSEFDERFVPVLKPMLARSELFVMNANHEMFSGGTPYFKYIDDKHAVADGVRQRQEGSYFCLESDRFQIIGIDTAYHATGRWKEPKLLYWLQQVLEAGKRLNRTNILLSGDEPYDLGNPKSSALLREDLGAFADRGLIDLWFWGNVHYCALYERGPGARFIGSCIGHGGYPYGRMDFSAKDNTFAPVRWHETEARFPSETGVRQDRGNNGFVMMELDHATGTVALEYIDWMRRSRHRASLGPKGGVLDFVP
jgi:hypothetical protein